MFKVLVIAYYFPPMGLSGVQRTLKFTKYMKDYNWEPTVITSGNTGYFAHDNSLMKEAEEAGIKIIRTEAKDPNSMLSKFGTIKLPRESVRKLFNRISQTFFIPDNKISWSKKAAKIAEDILSKENFDAIFVTCPPFSSFVAIAELKKKFDVPIFVDYRDLWFDSYFSFYLTPFHRSIHKKLEYNSLKASDKIIVTNRQIKEKLLNNYQFLSFDDILIIRHGYDAKDFENVQPIPQEHNKMILTYSGIFVEYCTPKYFLEAFKLLALERPDIASNIELNFIGLLGKDHLKMIKNLKLEEYIKHHGYMDHNEVIKKIVSSHVLWFMVGKKKNIEAILPGKVYEYVGSQKPIIACVPDGAAKTSMEEYKASFITKPYDVVEIKNTLIHVHDLYKTGKLPVPEMEYIEKHERKALTEVLTKQFQFFLKAEI
ncbi:MAG: glycosyltransferase [Bacteroidetes bacterium]|nr:glycosyltransferase [Bacteroidota bacterium]